MDLKLPDSITIEEAKTMKSSVLLTYYNKLADDITAKNDRYLLLSDELKKLGDELMMLEHYAGVAITELSNRGEDIKNELI
jgi:hypothetical protein